MRARLAMFVTAALVSVPSLASATSGNANAHATLVRVHVFEAAKGRPQPTVANCSNDGTTTETDYDLTGWQSAGGTARLNVATVPPSLPSAKAALQSAFDAWSNATDAPAFEVTTDGTVTRQTANQTTDLLFGRVAGNAIAVTYTWRWSNGTIESDTVFNSAVRWRDLGDEGDGCAEDQPYYDLMNIAVHEFGHIYGLDHPTGGRFESMYRYGFTGETLKRSPGLGDRTGINEIY